MKKILVILFLIASSICGVVLAQQTTTQQQINTLNNRISIDNAQITALQSGAAESNSAMQGQLNQIAILNNEIQMAEQFLNSINAMTNIVDNTTVNSTVTNSTGNSVNGT
jgi:hypothetical protein